VHDLEIEELKMLQQIIGRYDDHEIKIRSWLLGLLVALSIARYSEKIHMPGAWLGYLASGLVVLFLFIEVIHRIPKRKAIDRVAEVERAIRGECDYDGPRINEKLTQSAQVTKVIAEAAMLPVYGFYGLVITIVWVLVLAAP
jgi:hypothetical protein